MGKESLMFGDIEIEKKNHQCPIFLKDADVEKVLEFNPIENGLFRGCSRIGGGAKRSILPKICHTYPTMMKLGTVIPYLKKIQKIYESCDTPREFC